MKPLDRHGNAPGLTAITKTLTTDASGDATATFENVLGRLYALKLTAGTLDAGTDLTLSGAVHGTLYAKSNTNAVFARPRGAVVDAAGSAISGLAETFQLLEEDLTATIAQGGNVKTGSITLYLLRGLS